MKAVVASTIGNVVEWIDWAIYGLASPFIAAQFFPSDNPTISLIQAFATFALGFMVRPLGAMVIGPYGDKHGRNKALALSIFIMGAATGAIGLLPTYASIGILAPLLLISLRIVQGFALGGEWGAATSYLYELAPPHRRCFISSFRPCGTGLGFFIGSAVLTVSTFFCNPQQMSAWGWRIPFIFAFLTALVGLYIRMKLEDSPLFLKAQKEQKIAKQPLKEMIKNDKRGMAVVFGFAMIFNSVYYVLFTAIPTYLSTTINMTYATAIQITAFSTLFYSLMVPVFGWLADSHDKKKLLLVVSLGYIFLSYPGFMLFGTGNYAIVVAVCLFFSLLMALFAGVSPVVLNQQFATRTRNTSMSVAFTLQASLLGGTAPLCVTWLSAALNDPLAPAYYMIAATVPALLSTVYASYTAPDEAEAPVRSGPSSSIPAESV